MKNVTMLFLFTVTIFHSKAQSYQPMAVEGVHWILEDICFDELRFTTYGYLVQGDTLINDTLYKKIYHQGFKLKKEDFPQEYFMPYQVIGQTLFAGMRDDTLEQKVYIRPFDNDGDNCSADGSRNFGESLLYDFSLAIGDVFNSCFVTGKRKLIVENTDTIFLFGKERRRILLQDEQGFNLDVGIIEGVGNEVGPFSLIVPQVSSTCMPGFINHCVGGDSECNLIVLTEQLFHDEVIAFPNPVSNVLYLKNTSPNTYIQIFNSSGNLILAENTNKINVSSLPKGIYALSINNMSPVRFVKN